MQTSAVGLSAPSQQTIDATDNGKALLNAAPAGSLLSVYLPVTAVQVESSWVTGKGVQQQVPFSGDPSTQKPYQYVLDGNPGVLTIVWMDTTNNQQYQFPITIQGQYGQLPAPPPAPPPPGPIYHTPGPIFHIPGPNPPAPPAPPQTGGTQTPSPTASSGYSSGTIAAIVVSVLALAAAGGYAYYRHQHPLAPARAQARR